MVALFLIVCGCKRAFTMYTGLSELAVLEYSTKSEGEKVLEMVVSVMRFGRKTRVNIV